METRNRYKIINIDKGEFIQIPLGTLYLKKFSYSLNICIQIFINKLLNEWKYDRCFIINDNKNTENNELAKKIKGELKPVSYRADFRSYKENRSLYDMADDYAYSNYPYCSYGFYPVSFSENDYDNLQTKDYITTGYLYNHAKKIFVDLSHCPFSKCDFEQNGRKIISHLEYISPIILLLTIFDVNYDEYSGNNINLIGHFAKDMFEDGRNIEFSLKKLNRYENYLEFIPNFYEYEKKHVRWDDSENIENFKKEEYIRQKQTITICNNKGEYIAKGFSKTKNRNLSFVNIKKIYLIDENTNQPCELFEHFQDELGNIIKNPFEINIFNKKGIQFKRKNNISLDNDCNIFFVRVDGTHWKNKRPFYDCYISTKMMKNRFLYSKVNDFDNHYIIRNIYGFTGEFKSNANLYLVMDFLHDLEINKNIIDENFIDVHQEIKEFFNDSQYSLEKFKEKCELLQKFKEKKSSIENQIKNEIKNKKNWDETIEYIRGKPINIQ